MILWIPKKFCFETPNPTFNKKHQLISCVVNFPFLFFKQKQSKQQPR